MCLDSLDYEYKKKKSGVGWKVFYKAPDVSLRSECRRVNKNRPIGRWLKAPSNSPRIQIRQSLRYSTYTFAEYKASFHIFRTRREARLWKDKPNTVIRKVKYRKAHSWGTQVMGFNYYNVIVAKEILILPPSKGR